MAIASFGPMAGFGARSSLLDASVKATSPKKQRPFNLGSGPPFVPHFGRWPDSAGTVRRVIRHPTDGPRVSEQAFDRHAAVDSLRSPANHLPAHTNVLACWRDRAWCEDAAMAEPQILVVEDDDDVRDYLETALVEGGYEVEVVATAEDARALMGKSRYTLVIADWWLSDGTGLMILDEAANHGAKTFLLSGYVTELFGETARRHSLLKKPIAPGELVAAVHQAIGDPTGKADKAHCG
jgi:CheY-like chemotaxis protein